MKTNLFQSCGQCWVFQICWHIECSTLVAPSCRIWNQFTSVQLCPALCILMDCSMPGFPVHHQIWSLPKLKSTELVMPSNHLILCPPLLFLPSIFPSIRVFTNESILHIRWPKYWSFSFSICLPMNIQDWFPLGLTGLISLQSKGLSRVFYNTTVQKHHLFGAQISLQSNFHTHTWQLEKNSLD